MKSMGGLQKLLYATPYDPDNPLCDYDKTWWEANPKGRASEQIAKLVIPKLMPVKRRDIEDVFIAGFSERVEDIKEVLSEKPLTLICDHNPDLESVMMSFAAGVSIARSSDQKRYGARLNEIFRLSHGIGTRAMTPIMIDFPKPLPDISLVGLTRLIFSPHYSFPRTTAVEESSIDQNFIGEYNDKLREECVEAAGSIRSDIHGYHTLWTVAPAGTRNTKSIGEDGEVFETIPSVNEATTKLLQDMGSAAVLINSRFSFESGGKPELEIGEIVSEIGNDTLPNMMREMAKYQTIPGQKQVFYAGDVPD
jgi:hypothetical protein